MSKQTETLRRYAEIVDAAQQILALTGSNRDTQNQQEIAALAAAINTAAKAWLALSQEIIAGSEFGDLGPTE